jgi:hypothetical protein
VLQLGPLNLDEREGDLKALRLFSSTFVVLCCVDLEKRCDV